MLKKIALIVIGYVLACIVASGAVYVNQLFIQDPLQASAGMSAFGDMILFIVTFGFTALFPTGLVLYFLFVFIRNKAKNK